MGIIFIGLAFLPKFVSAVLAIPGPVVAAYLVVILSLIFVFGMKILLQEGLDHRMGLVVGVAFWIGTAFQLDWIYPEYFQGAWEELLGNGMTVGGFTVILLTLFMEATGGRPARLKTRLTAETWPEIDAFLTKFAERRRWGEQMELRLRAVGEETLQILTRGKGCDPVAEAEVGRRLLLIVRPDGDAADLEFIATTDEDQLAMLSEAAASLPVEAETPLRLLRHYASSIRHQQYHDIDILTIRVEPVQRSGA
ncbi:hypothetical protein [Candidatus Palauibacter sp.]|uniref:hypothetical protein n=1 Tax=Candidatus Palauibacter sp. TaxID=3101350 RepID=UPI003CC66DE1